MKTRFLATLVLAGVLTSASPALGQQPDTSWFAGVAVGRLDTTFLPYYTYYEGGTPDQFENKADGVEVQILAGQRRRLTDRLSLSIQGSAAFNSFTWSLAIPEEPSALEYALPYRFAVSLAPEVHVSSRLSIFAELGGGIGRVRQQKTSPTGSVYDVDKMRPTVNIGGGVKVNASAGIDLFARVEHVRYRTHEFDTFTASNVRVEHVKDAPRALGISIGITRRF